MITGSSQQDRGEKNKVNKAERGLPPSSELTFRVFGAGESCKR